MIKQKRSDGITVAGILATSLFTAIACVSPCADAQPVPPRIVWLSPVPEVEGGPFYTEFRSGMRELGYVDGRNIVLEPRWADGTAAGTEKLIVDTLAGKPAIVVSQGSAGPLIRKSGTSLPVVFGYSGDPVEAGMIDSLARPGRNTTGITYMHSDLIGKRMEFLKELLPLTKRVAVVASPGHAGDRSERRATEIAAARLGVALEYFEFRAGVKMPELLAAVEKSHSDAALFFPTQSIMASREAIAAWAQKNRIPTISGWAQFATSGNVMSYGPNLAEASRRLAYYVDRILKGANPGDLPVEQPTIFELLINLKTAKALSIKVPQSLLLRATTVIE